MVPPNDDLSFEYRLHPTHPLSNCDSSVKVGFNKDASGQSSSTDRNVACGKCAVMSLKGHVKDAFLKVIHLDVASGEGICVADERNGWVGGPLEEKLTDLNRFAPQCNSPHRCFRQKSHLLLLQ